MRISERTNQLYWDITERVAEMSNDPKYKVGCLIVNGNNIISYAFNGTPSGRDNNPRDENGKTKIEVLHAEENALMKALVDGVSTKGSTLYVTHAPCIQCAKLIYNAQIENVLFNEDFKDNQGYFFLKEMGVNIQKIEKD